MQLYTKRLILRPWLESDAESLYKYAKNPAVGPIAGWSVHTSVENSRDIIRDVLAVEETYAVCLKSDNAAIGCISLMIGKSSNFNLIDSQGEIGYWIGEPFWGQGLIPEACTELIRHAFEDLRLEKLWCGYFDGNEKSKRVQEKCGFTYHHTNTNVYWKLTDDIRTVHVTCLDNYLLPTPEYIIRGMSQEEIPLLKDFLYEAIFVPTGMTAPPKSIIESPELQVYIEDFGSKKDDACLVAEIDKKIVGAVWVRIMNDYGHIDNNTPSFAISVYKEYRKSGIGTALMKEMLYLLKQKGYKQASLSVQKANYAVRMYNNLGFKIVDKNDEEYIMVCQL